MTGPNTAWGAVRMLARHELRSRWRSILLLGLASGIVFGAALATVAVLVRADTAYARIVSASHLADARVGTYNIFNDVKREREVKQRLAVARGSILARPDVVASQQLSVIYARREIRDVEYVEIWAPRHQWDGLDEPVVMSGRVPAEDRPDEVMVNEQYAKAHALRLGDVVDLGIYRSGQVRDFDNGLGRPAAGRISLHVVGTYRVADSGPGFSGLMAGPAFAARYDATAAIGEIMLLRLDRSMQSPVFGTVQGQAIRLDRQMTALFGTGFYNYVDYVEPRDFPDPAIGPTRAVLRSGLGLLAVVIGLGGLVLSLQLAARWAALARTDHGVERALGMRSHEQVTARLLAVLPALVVALALSVIGTLLGGYLEPPGALNRFEPHPGWLGQPWTAAAGAVMVLVVLVSAVLLTRAAALRRAAPGGEQTRGRARMPRRFALPPVLRLAAALGSPRGSRGPTVRSRATVVGLAASVALLIVVVELGGQLTSLQDAPPQWGWTADFGVSGDSLAVDGMMLRDRRVRDAEQLIDAPVHLLDRGRITRITGYGRGAVKGALPYHLLSGRLPQSIDEAAIGPRLAEEHDLRVGDRLVLAGPTDYHFVKHVTGIVVLPTLENEPLGRNVLMSRSALRGAAISTGYSNLLVRGVTPALAAAVRARLAPSVEIEDRTPPNTIVALSKLAAPARMLIVVLLIGAVLLIGEYVALLLRRRGTQLAIAASIGMTRRQLIAATAAATLATASAAVLIGVPIGWAVSRLVLVEMGPRLGVGLSGPGIASALLVAVIGLAVAAVLALGMSAAKLRRRALSYRRHFEATAW